MKNDTKEKVALDMAIYIWDKEHAKPTASLDFDRDDFYKLYRRCRVAVVEMIPLSSSKNAR